MSDAPMVVWPDPVVEWAATSLVDAEEPTSWIRALAEHIVDGGIPIARFRIMFRILHPQLGGVGLRWQKGHAEVELSHATRGLERRDLYLNSPTPLLDAGAPDVWRSLRRPDNELEFPILKELKDDGMTDYLALPAPMSVGPIGFVSFATDQPDGFTVDHVERLRQITRAAARGVEIIVRHETVLSLLKAYLGQETGGRVLAGAVERGDGQSQDAVIWFSDLRKSTALSEALPPPDYLALLNNYFDCLAEPVLHNGGEVLRFIGDAVLAIFPVSDDSNGAWKAACDQALVAALEAESRIDALNKLREADGSDPINYGIGLHLGEVHYGNIGTAERVEFTVIGKAANTAAKVEAMCKSLKQRLIVSEGLTQYHEGPWKSLGRHQIPGTSTEMELFTNG